MRWKVKEREKTKTQLGNENKEKEDLKAKRGRTDREEKDCIKHNEYLGN